MSVTVRFNKNDFFTFIVNHLIYYYNKMYYDGRMSGLTAAEAHSDAQAFMFYVESAGTHPVDRSMDLSLDLSEID